MRKILCYTALFLISALLLPACKKDSKRRIRKNHQQEVGHSAEDLLSDKKYETIILELQYMQGFRPSDAAITRLKEFTAARLNKKVQVRYSEIEAYGKAKYSLDDIRAIEKDHRLEYTSRKEIAVYFLFLDGGSEEDMGNEVVLGFAHFNTSMAIFEKTIKDATGGVGEPATDLLEAVVMNHELCHLLGLVNLGSSMQTDHQDTVHGNHCTNENCLMNWEAETGNMISNMIGMTDIPGLDDNCIADLQANGGR